MILVFVPLVISDTSIRAKTSDRLVILVTRVLVHIEPTAHFTCRWTGLVVEDIAQIRAKTSHTILLRLVIRQADV